MYKNEARWLEEGLVDRNETKPKCSLNEHKEEWYLILSNNMHQYNNAKIFTHSHITV